MPGRLHFSVERLVRVSEPQLDPNVVTLPTRCHHHPRWNRAGPDFQQVVPRDTWYLVVVLENRWALRSSTPMCLPAHLQNKSHGKSPFFIQLATISHLLVRHSLEILLILVASRLLCKWMHSVDSGGVRTARMLMRPYDFCVDACIRRGPCLILRGEEKLPLPVNQLD